MTAEPMPRPEPVVRRFVLVALWAPLALVAAGVAVQLVLLPHVPATIAVHWNAAGQANGFAPAWTQPLATIGFGLGLPALIALTTLPGLRRGERGATYRLMGAVAASVSALATVAFTATLAMQVGRAADDAPAIWPVLVASLAAGVLAGVLAWFVQPAQDVSPDAAVAAAPLPLGATERAVWLRATAMRPGAVAGILLAVLAVAIAATLSWVVGAPIGTSWLLTGIAVLLLALAATTIAFHVRIDDSGLHVDSVLGLPRFHVPLADVASAARVQIAPMAEFGGWGVRLSTDRRFGIVLRTGEGIEVVRRNGRRFVVTVDDAQTGAGLLEALAQRAAQPR